jgi:hypothetical protein
MKRIENRYAKTTGDGPIHIDNRHPKARPLTGVRRTWRLAVEAMEALSRTTLQTPVDELVAARKKVWDLGERAGMCLVTVPDMDMDTACVADRGHDGGHIDRSGRRWG